MADDGCLLNVHRLCFAQYHHASKMYTEKFILIVQDDLPWQSMLAVIGCDNFSIGNAVYY